MVSLKALVLALGALSSGVVAHVDPAQCFSLKAIASAGFPDPSSLSASCTSVFSYTVPPAVTTTKTTSTYVAITKYTTATQTAYHIRQDTVTELTTVFGRRRRSLPEPALEARQSLGDLPLPLIQQLCDCLDVAHPTTSTKTATLVMTLTDVRTVTVTSRTTKVVTSTALTTVQRTTTIPRVTVTGSTPTQTPGVGSGQWSSQTKSEFCGGGQGGAKKARERIRTDMDITIRRGSVAGGRSTKLQGVEGD
ncbi:hypothetical protein VC83_08141 [Pseudogymnoascus destructans]|uniref:Uncharacterized protein n=2 Tax=Pseudogymnoascus destructans TaxID=655981 RepID=L8G201_PSED2|nr:uncharacterized protein VC83_08141 [Pseudogymnoascus destructans]ELR06001.1 hypothetical protein GMDG_01962 [Pseudogymnoascus destructans 20631-21]OAF55309.1 hypothetical protein VC83_08141 [Pseudogymnoascus destructans]